MYLQAKLRKLPPGSYPRSVAPCGRGRLAALNCTAAGQQRRIAGALCPRFFGNGVIPYLNCRTLMSRREETLAAEWLVTKKPAVIGFDFAQEENRIDYQKADEILTSGMRVHRTLLPNITCQIENLVNLGQIGPKAKIIALPAKWKMASAPARVVAILED